MQAKRHNDMYRLYVEHTDLNRYRRIKALPGIAQRKNYWSCRRTAGTYKELIDLGFEIEDDSISDFDFPLLQYPTLLNHKPWGHQDDGYNFIVPKPGSILGYDMGTGKTLIAIMAMLATYEANGRKDVRVLIVCPKAVIPVWRHELDEHYAGEADDLAMIELTKGGTKKKAHDLEMFHVRNKNSNSIQVAVINYESFWRGELGAYIEDQVWDIIIMDESQKIKSPTGKASKFAGKLESRGKRRMCLTGTPMPHSPLDIFGQMRFIDSTIFGDCFYKFRSRFAYCHPQFPSKILRLINEDEFKLMLQDYVLRVDSDEVLDLPPTIETFVDIELKAKSRKHYKEIEEELTTWVAENEDHITVTNALGKLIKMRQLASGFIMDEERHVVSIGSEKIEALEELLEEIGEKEPVVIFTNFKQEMLDVRMLAKKLGRNFREISGSCHDYEKIRQEVEDGKAAGQIIGVQIQSGGAGINLSHCAFCIYYSLTYSLGDHLQSMKRVHRPGQSRTTRYYYLTCKDTLDSVIYKSLIRKEEVVDAVLVELKRRIHHGEKAIA